ncbi:MAG: class I SAM-dependent methyltransferase [Oligoflexus sp.]
MDQHASTRESEHLSFYSGLARVSDLQSEPFKQSYKNLSNSQKIFTDHQTKILNKDYLERWPTNPLHTWSRIWEYPFVYNSIEKICSTDEFKERDIKIADFGSGATFFPLTVAKENRDVYCIDHDPVCLQGMEKASQLGIYPHKVHCIQSDDKQIPAENRFFDIVYSVSVLEHVPQRIAIIDEIARILKPGGYFIVTMDLDMRGDHDIPHSEYRKLMTHLMEKFEVLSQYSPTHPDDLLTPLNSPYGYGANALPYWEHKKVHIKGFLKNVKARVIKHKKHSLFDTAPFNLYVEGLVCRKKGD